MNRIYRLVWSHVASAFIPVAEFSAGYRGKASRSGRRKLLISGALAAGMLPAMAVADDVYWAQDYPTYAFPTDPGYNFDQVINTGTAYTIDVNPGPTNYPAGTTLNILGAIPAFPAYANNGVSSTSISAIDALPAGVGNRIITITAIDSQGVTTPITADNIANYTYSPSPAIPQKNQELNVQVQGLEGSYEVISVYDSASFTSAADVPVANMQIPIFDPDSVRILNNVGLAYVSEGGGTANINVGADTTGTTPIASAQNTIDLLAKNSTLAFVAADSGNAGAANWQSDNYIHFRPAAKIATQSSQTSVQSTQYNYTQILPQYQEIGNTGRVIRLADKEFAITSSADIADVNDYLLGEGAYAGKPQVQYWLLAGASVNGSSPITSSVEAQTIYNNIISGLLGQAESTTINVNYNVWNDLAAHTNNATLDTGNLRVIYATGQNASGTVTAGGSLAVDGATSVMEGDHGAVITNNGAINAWSSSGNSPLTSGMRVNDATATNNGVLNAGLFLEKDGSNQNVNNSSGAAAIIGEGGSTITNNGHINVAITDTATHNAYGIAAGNTTNVTNAQDATIAIVGNIHNTDGKGGAYGVLTAEDANFTNRGAMYVGSTPVTDSTAPTAVNLAGSGNLTAAIASLGDGTLLNDTTGTITLLENTRNAAGILVNGGGATVTNDGQINVLGKLVNDSAAANYGMYVKDNTGVVTNNGDIQVDGDNNIALRVLAQDANAQMTSTSNSSIIVGSQGDLGGTDENPYAYRNYALYAEGLNGNAATVQFDSAVRLLAAGAIGVHARGDATITIGAPASLTFENSDQIGYYAWGQGASINLANPTISDAGQAKSILFAVDNGATFTGATTGGNYNLTVSGNGSTGVFANGVDTLNGSVATNMTTGNALINVSGENAVGVKVTGGAVGTISNGAINLAGDNTTAVQVDGRDYSINGDIGSDDDALDTKVTSDANIVSAAGQNGITGYNVSHKGDLLLNSGADITLAGNTSTGVLLHDGGIATVGSNVSVAGTDNIGVDIQNAGQLTNNGTISVSGAQGSGNVGVRVQGAGAIVNQLGEVSADGGLAAVQLTGVGANLTVNGTGNHISASGGADGVLIDSAGASSFNASNTTIDITDSGAGINNNANASSINLSNVTINADDGPAIRTAVTFAAEGTGNVLNVSGSGGGFAFMQADGSATTGDLTIGTGYTIYGNGDGSRGVLARTNGKVTSGTNITMASGAGAAIEAINASSLTNNGIITTSSDTGSTILAQNAGAFSNTRTITSSSTSNSQSLIDLSGDLGARSISNSGTITSNSQNATVIDATGSANHTLSNTGVLQAASSTAKAIALGSGNDSVTLSASGQQTQGEILMGSGSDQFSWSGGSLTGGVTFEGADGQDRATINTVDIADTTHILSEGGSGSTLTFTNIVGNIGSLAADNLSLGTNIGSGWSTLTLDGATTDMRVVNDLTLSGTPVINVNGGATLRSGNSATQTGGATVHNYNIATAGSDSLVSFDGNQTQTYSGVISGSGGMERIGGGNTTLLGDNTYTGNTLIGSNSELSLGNGGTVGSLSEQTNITDNGILTVNHSDAVSLNGVISGSGRFQQMGAGITRLGGANSYSGATDVQHGTLLINGVQSGTGLTTVNSGSTLGGYGTLGGDVVFNAGTTLKPGDDARGNGTGILTVNGNLTLAGDTNSQFQLGEAYTPGGALNDLVEVEGNLTLDGNLNVSLTNGGSFLPGVYRLFNYGGSLTNNTLDIASLPPNDAENYGVQTNINHQVNLVLNFVNPTNQLQFWDGDVNGSNHGDGISGNGQVDGGFGYWTALISGSSNNWTQQDGVGNAPWAQASFAVFQGAANTVLVSDIFGEVLTSGMQFTTDGYKLIADPDLPDSQLRFVATNPPGVFAPDNSYASQGATHADSYFAIRVGDGAAGADVTTTIAVDLVQNDVADGNIRLLKTDPGRLILTGNNQITGGVEVWNGTLNITRDNALGASTNSVLLKNGASFQAGADLTTSRLFFVDGTGGGTFDTYGNVFTPTGVIGGDGPLTIEDTSAGTGSGQLVLNIANTYLGNTTVKGKNGTGTLAVNVNATGAFGKQDSTVSLTDEAQVNVNGSANAQTHTFAVNNATLAFNDSASAGQSMIGLTDGTARFTGSSNAGSAAINVDADSQLLLSGSADGGTSVTTNAGLVAFSGNAQAANARLVNQSGANVALADVASKTSIGSLSGAGTVDLGNKTLSEGNLNLNDTISGLISGVGGGLEKVGTGILTLTADNTFTGAAAVLKGALLINGNQSAATGATSVASNATLGGEGTLGGNVSVADNGHLAPGKDLSSVGILTMNNLSLAENSQLDFQFGKSNVPDGKDALNDLLVVNGDLTLDGRLNITEPPGGKFDVGVYRVINYSGNLTNNSLLFGTVPEAADQLYIQTSVANQVNLVNTTGLVLNFWDGTGGANGRLKNNGKIDGGDGLWQNSGGNDNWTTDQTDPGGSINAPFSDGAFAVFSGKKGNVTVDNSLGEVLISGAQFATNGYVINDGVITTNTADTVIRVGDGTALGKRYTATINSDITGRGGIDKTDVGTLVLNGNNSYQGGTTVGGGVLQVSGDQNLGATGTGITLNGGTFRYGAAFDTARAWTLSGDGGTIDTNGSNVSLLAAVSGSGGLIKTGDGTLTLTQDSRYSGLTTIRNGTLQLGNGGDTGSATGNILNLDTLVVNRNNTVNLDGVISGTGDFIQRGSGTTVLNGLNTWRGYTLVENGTLLAGGVSRLSARSSHIVSQNATLDTGGHNQTVANLVNQGTVNLRGGHVGSSLTVNGDYVGMDGTIKIAAQQHSPGVADKLVINGGKATGTTRLDIDVSQLGEPTTGDGIRVVEALNGATTTAQTTKDAFNIGSDKLIAGAWQYQLFAGNASGAGEDWFLRAGYNPVVPGFNSVAAITRQADLYVLGTLHQRVGDEQPWRADVPADQENRFWARYLTKTVDIHLDDATSSKSHSQYDGMQMGVDLWQNDQWRTGIYTTFMDIDSSVSGNTGMGGGSAYNSTFSTYVGGYATWTDSNGLYVDNVLQYGYHSVDLKNLSDGQTYHPDGNSVTASVEVGKPWQLGDSNWAFEPQAQLVWQWSDFDDVTLNDGANTHVGIDADSAVIGRLGARLTADYDTHVGKVKPYVRVNYWQELTDGDDAVTYRNSANSHGKTTLNASQKYSATEAAVGATWTVTNDVQAYTEVGRTWDNGGDTNVDANLSASVGMKIRF
ncbi:autotransporter-associated beta strand repeat-containing protein [Scandinavium sp. V105_16]|uniref:Autotransporter-associated beta strand repeat-containing protein n=1 Tax=Scandinavium lactucae TaxID=3095028 RepID=A0AAJ2RY73_9ENTR|nr:MULTISPECIES: autotransporter-associated beta strand repeat-containing protein [unclassified Scandinavium]MDX6018795.1 autotransporter-associated beta strand repeat-containing protein [Scandinavium sp. V105_16]MDX6030244.1 autotransporter-associated beta strand repeat-containing protein [Scandinavium sp. V105_12]